MKSLNRINKFLKNSLLLGEIYNDAIVSFHSL